MNSFPFPSWRDQPSNYLREGAITLSVIDAHTEGEPLRIFTDFPILPGETILARRRYCREHFDHLRTASMWEPRGHADMYGCILTPPVSPQAQFGVLFLHNEGYSTMCGHGIIAVTTVVLETGMLPMSRPLTTVRIDTPAGLVTAQATIGEHGVEEVSFLNVPSFVQALDQKVDVPGLGSLNYDLAFGGAFYAIVKAEDVGLACVPQDFQLLIKTGSQIKKAISEQVKMQHPFEEDLNFLYGVIFTGPAEAAEVHSRNVCVFAEGEVDRSPTGTGVSARAAVLHQRSLLKKMEPVVIESILGSRFSVTVIEEVDFGPYKAIVPQVEGKAFITGRQEFFLDPRDPFRNGFILR